MDLVLESEIIDRSPLSLEELLKRRLSAAKKRARYWSGVVHVIHESYALKKRRTLSPGTDFQAAMEDVQITAKRLSEITGKPVKPFDPRAKVTQASSTMGLQDL